MNLTTSGRVYKVRGRCRCAHSSLDCQVEKSPVSMSAQPFPPTDGPGSAPPAKEIEAKSNESFSTVTEISPEKPPVDLNTSVKSLILTAVSPMSSPPKERTSRSQMRTPAKRPRIQDPPQLTDAVPWNIWALAVPQDQESDCDEKKKSMFKGSL